MVDEHAWSSQGEGITDILMSPAKLKDTIPGISGTRNLSDNISDLKAQVRVRVLLSSLPIVIG